jgi:hypothetical protein
MRERSVDESFMDLFVFHRLGLVGKIGIVQDRTLAVSFTVLIRYRIALGIFIVGLVLSGISALPLRSELSILDRWFCARAYRTPPSNHVDLSDFISNVHSAVVQTYARFPFFGYATDWLAFGHFVIAAFFILPFMNPIRYRAILRVGLAACAGVIILALICGPIRGIPFFWTLIDCSFGIFGAIPLFYCLRLTAKLDITIAHAGS